MTIYPTLRNTASLIRENLSYLALEACRPPPPLLGPKKTDFFKVGFPPPTPQHQIPFSFLETELEGFSWVLSIHANTHFQIVCLPNPRQERLGHRWQAHGRFGGTSHLGLFPQSACYYLLFRALTLLLRTCCSGFAEGRTGWGEDSPPYPEPGISQIQCTLLFFKLIFHWKQRGSRYSVFLVHQALYCSSSAYVSMHTYTHVTGYKGKQWLYRGTGAQFMPIQH